MSNFFALVVPWAASARGNNMQKMRAEIIDINERARDAWDAYVAAKERAQATDDFRDGLAAGRAWRTFLNLFAGPEDRMEVAPKILEYPYGARR